MARIKRGVPSRKGRKAVLKSTRGYYGRAKSCYRVALPRLEKSLQYAYRDRRNKKRYFRSLWIQRINAAVRECGMVYSEFMAKIKSTDIKLDRKSLSEVAISDFEGFKEIVKRVAQG
ncbi:MAG: ribosomal protein L20 [Candidatus Xenolissoclinum pacificiensis L6]|uniref:Large ribosomal subunit protein bL20 n=1 Tax=Candidatus Xenolissoclinum pacificiensis L6 TaxID=1401685 RepID=W2V230_9RICK|nr:MAG: ribosomal protein L20 [Candidatus Xenolissoclinum pacificiensis L6]